jgi:DNA/RNA endonuclease YhcR with UshA esterase domain
MRIIAAFLTLLALLGRPALAQEAATNSPATNSPPAPPVRIAAAEAKDHIGANAVVTGEIAEVNIAERLTRLNLDKPFPEQPFTAVIFGAKTNLFPDLPALKGKRVEVSGKIADYRGHPQIVLNGTNQLKVVEKVVKP